MVRFQGFGDVEFLHDLFALFHFFFDYSFIHRFVPPFPSISEGVSTEGTVCVRG